MSPNDKNLIRQMIKAGRFNAVQDLLIKKNEHDAQVLIKKMGNKWCCHPSNSPTKGNYGI